jgi:hypothetical protein
VVEAPDREPGNRARFRAATRLKLIVPAFLDKVEGPAI